jgi:hypothetical protein
MRRPLAIERLVMALIPLPRRHRHGQAQRQRQRHRSDGVLERNAWLFPPRTNATNQPLDWTSYKSLI